MLLPVFHSYKTCCNPSLYPNCYVCYSIISIFSYSVPKICRDQQSKYLHFLTWNYGNLKGENKHLVKIQVSTTLTCFLWWSICAGIDKTGDRYILLQYSQASSYVNRRKESTWGYSLAVGRIQYNFPISCSLSSWEELWEKSGTSAHIHLF